MMNFEEFSVLVCLFTSSVTCLRRATPPRHACVTRTRTVQVLHYSSASLRRHKSSQGPPLRTLRTQLRTPSSSTAAATSSSSTSRRRPSVAAGRSVSKQRPGPQPQKTRRWRAGASRCPSPRGRAAPRPHPSPARASVNDTRSIGDAADARARSRSGRSAPLACKGATARCAASRGTLRPRGGSSGRAWP